MARYDLWNIDIKTTGSVMQYSEHNFIMNNCASNNVCTLHCTTSSHVYYLLNGVWLCHHTTQSSTTVQARQSTWL